MTAYGKAEGVPDDGSGAFELYVQSRDGFKPAGVYACSACRCVARSKAQAERCCEPRLCSCGSVCEVGWTKCRTCRTRREEERQSKNWESAPKVEIADLTTEQTPKNCDLFLYSARLDKFYSDVDSLVEDHEDEGVPLDRVYLCVDDPGQRPEAYDIIESCCSDMFEEAQEHISEEEEKRLQAFLDEWWERNRPPGVVPSKTGVLLSTRAAEAQSAG